MPKAYEELLRVRDVLEKRFRDMQDLEFTIEDDKLFLLQTRNGKRTGFAAVRIATDMVDEGLINADEAVARVEPEQLVQLLAPIFPTKEKEAAVKDGPASGPRPARGAGSGLRPRRAHGVDAPWRWPRRAKPWSWCARRRPRRTSPG